MLDFDTMLMHVGEFGLYQKILFVFQAPFCIFVTFVSFGQLFIMLYPRNYWCEKHFNCLSDRSDIPGSQRRNISFAERNDGIFRNDPCRPNNINEAFLKSLHAFNLSPACARNRSRGCVFNDEGTTWSSSASSSDRNRDRNRRPWRPSNIEDGDETGDSGRTARQGQYGQRGQAGQGGNSWQGNRDWEPSWGGNGGGRYSTSTWRPGGSRPGNGQSGNNMGKLRRGKNTEINSPYVGWPQPECDGSYIDVVVHPNTTVNSTSMKRRQIRMRESYYKTMESMCKTKWNRSELPYATIVTDGDWWCYAELYTFIAQAIFFVGAIVGGLLIGWVADTFGRVPALVIANVLGAIGGSLSAINSHIALFSFFRFIAGMAFDNCFTMMYILVLEFCGPTYRTLVANLSIAIFYTIGTIFLPVLAVAIGDWQIFQLVTSIPMLLALLALFFVPESARWLLSKGRAHQATKILRNFAKVNGRKVDEQVFVEFEEEAVKLSEEWKNMEEPNLTAAFKTPRLRRTFIFLIIFWSMIALVYDGHNRNILNLADENLDVFWLFAIASMTEFPADILLIFTLDRFGRRWLAFGSMTLSAGFSIISAIITPERRLAFLITAIISRFWVNVAFNIGLQYAAELLPTVIRAQGVNAIHIMGYVATIISPFVAAIGRSNPTLSLFLLGAFALTAGIVSLFLAETLGEELPNTLEEAEAFGKNQSFWNCPICAKEVEEEDPLEPPPTIEDRGVVLRNALRGSIRGATYRSSMISNASSGGSGGNRGSRYIGMEGGITHRPEPTANERTKLRRITH